MPEIDFMRKSILGFLPTPQQLREISVAEESIGLNPQKDRIRDISNQIEAVSTKEQGISYHQELLKSKEALLLSSIVSKLKPKYELRRRDIIQDAENFNSELNSLEQFYLVNEMSDVRNFLRRNRFLIPLLKEIPEKIYGYFGKSQKLTLNPHYEFESARISALWVDILTELSSEAAFPLLENFDSEWWLENLGRTDCKLSVSLEYI